MSVIVLPQAEDHRRVEKALPGFMFALCFETLRGQGHEVRADLEELANKTSQVALDGTFAAHQQKLAGIVADTGYQVMKHAGADDDIPLLIGALSQLLVVLKDRGVNVDDDGVLIALSITAEIDDGVMDWGQPGARKRAMGRLDNELRRRGYFMVTIDA